MNRLWKEEIQEYLDREKIQAARDNVNAFAEFCFKDEKGKSIVQAVHHLTFQDLCDKNEFIVMHFPVEHGKTTQTKIRILWLLGKYPDQQFAYVSSKAAQAQKVVGSIAREIEQNKQIKRVFPDLEPARGTIKKQTDSWAKSRIRVAGCPPGMPDPSLAAYGLDSGILGARLHGIFIDNVLDRYNTQTPQMREKTIDIIDNEVMTRVLPGGFIVIIDTAWHDDDALHVFSERDGWASAKFDAMEGQDGGTLWPARFSPERLSEIKGRVGSVAFDRMYRNRPLSQSTAYFKDEFWQAAYGRCRWVDEWTPDQAQDVTLKTGVDLASRQGKDSDSTAFVTVVSNLNRKQVINIKSGKMGATEIMRMIGYIFKTLHEPVIDAGGNAVFVVEDNAAQAYIVQAMRDAAMLHAAGLTPSQIDKIAVIGRTTTSKKKDQDLGLPGLAAAIEVGKYDFAAGSEARALREEMRVWTPDAHTGDRLMALWVAHAAFRELATSYNVDFI